MNPAQTRKIVCMPLYGIGDVLMSTPALKNIKEQTGASITFIHMFRSTYDVLEHDPNVDENIHFPFFEKGFFRSVLFLHGLRGKFDASINFYPTNRRDYNVSAYLVGAPECIGHRYVLRDMLELNILKNRTIMEDEALHNVEENLRLLSFLGLDAPEPCPLSITLAEPDRLFASQWFADNRISGGPLVGLHAGSSEFKAHKLKRWPMEGFVELIRRAADLHSDAVFLLFGGPEEDAFKEELKRAAGPGARVFNVRAGGIRQTAAIMSRCQVMVSNDSGLMHLSAALSVPTVALFGPTNSARLAPWGVRHRALALPVDCGPCFRYSPKPMRCVYPEDGPEYGKCIRQIGAAEVFEALAELLDEPNP